MALDAATLALCARELARALTDARIDKIFEPTRDEIVLNLRTRTDNPRLFLSARSGSARACLTKETFENPQTPPSFCMLLRKHFTGGRLLAVRTLPDERIVFFDFQCTNEMGDTVVNTMAAELMGRYSNLVLVQAKNPANPKAEGKIIDALKRVDFEDSEVRQLLPGLAYTLPPQPQKHSFLYGDLNALLADVRKKDLPAAEALIKTTGGVGPVVCREAALRAFGGRDIAADRMTDADAAALRAAVEEIRSVYASGGTPVAVAAPDGRPIEFSFLPLTQYAGGAQQTVYGSYSALLEGYYATKDKAERLRQKSRDLARTVKNLHERAVRKAAARREEQVQSAACEELRVFGELLSANLWAVERGAKSVTLTNYYDGSDVTIPLDVRLTPSANAQNDRLTLKTARGRDLWFHVKNAPGSHAVVMSGGRDIPDATKTQAAILAAVHSSQNGGAKVQVDYTEVKNVCQNFSKFSKAGRLYGAIRRICAGPVDAARQNGYNDNEREALYPIWRTATERRQAFSPDVRLF